jgi:hypothetical protein
VREPLIKNQDLQLEFRQTAQYSRYKISHINIRVHLYAKYEKLNYKIGEIVKWMVIRRRQKNMEKTMTI